jgi:Tol biopolymer transport system component
MHDIQPYYDIDSWSPDGGKIIFSSASQESLYDKGAMLHSDNGSIYTLDTGTGEVRWVIGGRRWNSHTGCFPIWHPDGQYMLFGSDDYYQFRMSIVDLKTMRTEEYDGLEPRQISSDGKKVLCLSVDSIRIFDFETRTQKVLIPFERLVDAIPEKAPPEGERWIIRHLKFNKDNSKFLMRFSTMTESIKHLLVADIDGASVIKMDAVTQAGDRWHHPSWLPDGKSILFGHRALDGTNRLYQIGCDNTGRKLVSGHPLGGHPISSPDGRFIVTDDYDSTKTNTSILLLDRSADTVEKLASFTVNLKRSNAHPSWNHDGTQILYHSDPGGFSNLYLIDLKE